MSSLDAFKSRIENIKLPNKKGAILNEPISDKTSKVRSRLILASALAILVEVYQLKLKTIPWLNIDVPPDAPHLLNGILAISVAYLTIIFLIYIGQDIQSWMLKVDDVNFRAAFDAFGKIRDSFYGLSKSSRANFVGLDPENKKALYNLIDNSIKEMPLYFDLLKNFSEQYRGLYRLRIVRIFLVDVLLPMILAFTALSKVGIFLVPLLRSIY